ncbi:MAG: GTP-binding protein [Coprobacillus sp.]
MKTRIYLFTGFLDSGKTSFITDTITKTEFCDGEKSLLIVSEQGEVKYDQEQIESFQCDIEYITSEDQWTYDYFKELENKYHPTQVLIELNGMFNVNRLMAASKPEGWEIVQVLTTVNASTFALYIQNMKSLIFSQVVHSDLLIFNRVNDSIKKSFLRNNIKAINSNVQIIYEKEDGTVNTIEDDDLPFDIEAPELEILDHDFGLFCMDALEHPERYNQKTITLKGKFIGLDKEIENGFVLGRMAMVCCEEDTSLIGMVCEHMVAKQLVPDEWIQVKGQIHLEYDYSIQSDVCILRVDELKVVPPLENEYVTFD